MMISPSGPASRTGADDPVASGLPQIGRSGKARRLSGQKAGCRFAAEPENFVALYLEGPRFMVNQL